MLATPERVPGSLASRAEQEVARVNEAADREEIRSVLAEWALCRDTGRFDRLRALFAPGATIQTTWCDGSADDFVNRSKASFGGAVRALHLSAHRASTSLAIAPSQIRGSCFSCVRR